MRIFNKQQKSNLKLKRKHEKPSCNIHSHHHHHHRLVHAQIGFNDLVLLELETTKKGFQLSEILS